MVEMIIFAATGLTHWETAYPAEMKKQPAVNNNPPGKVFRNRKSYNKSPTVSIVPPRSVASAIRSTVFEKGRVSESSRVINIPDPKMKPMNNPRSTAMLMRVTSI